MVMVKKMLFTKIVNGYGLWTAFFFYTRFLCAILLSFIFLNSAYADVNTNVNNNGNINNNTATKVAPIEESMTVVLTADDIKPARSQDEILDDAKEVPQDKPQNDKKEDAKSHKDVNADEKNHDENANQNKNEQSSVISIPVSAQDDFRQALPQVISQTQHIGTPEQPTIDGGLISAPELVGVLSATAENMTFDGSLSGTQALIFMKLNQVYFLWEGLKQYDLQRGLSRLKLTHEKYKNKLRGKCAQILTYWTAPSAKHTSHRPYVAIKRHKPPFDSRSAKGIRLTQLSEQPDFKGKYHGNA
jgi:hypothetical protein